METTIAETVVPLTATDIKALRLADTSICFYAKNLNEWGTGIGQIIARKRNEVKQEKNNPFAPSYIPDSEYSLSVYSRLTDYSDVYVDKARLKCYSYVPAYMEHIKTFAEMLKVGDILTLEWIRDNNSQYLSHAGLHNDELQVVVVRGNKRLCFKIESSICENNSARMIRY